MTRRRAKVDAHQVRKVYVEPLGLGYVEVVLPIRTYSKLNAREHWAKRARRAAQERLAASMLFPAGIKPPCVVTLTRVAPRALDDDNLRGAMKSIRDGIADKLGTDDGDPSIVWRYEQERGKQYAVDVLVTPRVESLDQTLLLLSPIQGTA